MNKRGKLLKNSIDKAKNNNLKFRKDYFTRTRALLYYLETTEDGNKEKTRKTINTLREIERSKRHRSKTSTTVSHC